jgi:RNA polymerase sigma factor (sigma-70 family)
MATLSKKPATFLSQSARTSGQAEQDLEIKLVSDLLSSPIDYMDSPEFHKGNATRRLYKTDPEIKLPDVTWYRPLIDDVVGPRGERNSDKGTAKPLTAAQERDLFLKYNFARFRASRIQEKVSGRRPTKKQRQDFLKWHGLAHEYRKQIAETNLALVLAMAKRTRMNDGDFADMVSEGNMALMRAVDKFDCERGFKFSTYACRAILKAFSRYGMKATKYRQRFPAEYDPTLEKSDHLETLRTIHKQESADEVRHIVLNNDANLSDMECEVIRHRFGLNKEANPRTRKNLTLEQVGKIIGVTKERVRQIQNKALAKIKVTLEDVHPKERAAVSHN